MRSTQLVRIAKERHAGSMGYAEAMLIDYNGKKKNPAQRLSINMVDSEEAMVSFSEKGSDEQVYSNY